MREGPSVSEMFNLKGRVAIITGGAGMLGVQHAKAILESGGVPVIVDLKAEGVNEVVGQLSNHYKQEVFGVPADIAVKSQVDSMVERIVKKFGHIDILINNAALTVKGGSKEEMKGYFSNFEDYPFHLWQKALDVNLTGLFLCTQAVGKVMVRQRSGVVLNIAAVYGLVSPDHRIYEGIVSQYSQEPFNTPISYSTTKSAVLNFTRYLATYWADKNIRVNSFCPGAVYDNHDEKFVRNLTYRIPMGRMAYKYEYKGVIAFLVSDASSYMTGSNLVVDGGWTSW